jgi:orotate phosphoribosyltransferase
VVGALYRTEYRRLVGVRGRDRGQRVAVVDAINAGSNAGSAILGTIADLRARGAEPVEVGALLVRGSAAPRFAEGQDLPLERVASLPNLLWSPSECPLCAAQAPLEDLAG